MHKASADDFCWNFEALHGIPEKKDDFAVKQPQVKS